MTRELLAAGTPRPWYPFSDHISGAPKSLGGGVVYETPVAQVQSGVVDARLIVRAVNEYEALLDIAEAFDEYTGLLGDDDDGAMYAYNRGVDGLAALRTVRGDG